MSKLLAAEELMRLVLISLCLLKACVCLLFEMHSFLSSFLEPLFEQLFEFLEKLI